MKKYIPTVSFYIIAFIVVYILNYLSPGQQDGGLGFGAVSIILLVLISIVLVFVNLFKGLKGDKEHLIIAGIHLLVLVVIVGRLFI